MFMPQQISIAEYEAIEFVLAVHILWLMSVRIMQVNNNQNNNERCIPLAFAYNIYFYMPEQWK